MLRYVIVKGTEVIGVVCCAIEGRVPALDEGEIMVRHDTADSTWSYNPDTGELVQYS